MLSDVYRNSATTLARFDLLISSLISVVIILLGQAIVSYEVFTGKTLPRRGLRRHWQRALLLASGYSVLVGSAITLELSPVFGLLLTAMLMTLFYALVSWRSYVERDQLMRSLRPFIASQRLYDGLLSKSRSVEIDLFPAFEALCVNVLDTRRAFLAAVGHYAPLVSTPLALIIASDPAVRFIQVYAAASRTRSLRWRSMGHSPVERTRDDRHFTAR